VIGVDTNVLVYSHRGDSPWHAAATRVVRELAEGSAAWAIPWPCIHEFLAIVTHPRIFNPPTPLDRAIDQVDAWLASPSLVLLAEEGGYWEELQAVVSPAQAIGPLVHDARVAALCRVHGVRELWTADRDFGRFPGLSTRNPLVG
jgi:hypothetical protein